jgi:hypothetical protein
MKTQKGTKKSHGHHPRAREGKGGDTFLKPTETLVQGEEKKTWREKKPT